MEFYDDCMIAYRTPAGKGKLPLIDKGGKACYIDFIPKEESTVHTITSRPLHILEDHMMIYRFMVENYDRAWTHGVPAPFWEYALCSSWMDKSMLHRCRLWFDGAEMVAFCFMENPVTDCYFSLKSGYEFLADEMIAHAKTHMPGADSGQQKLVLFGGQRALMDAAARAGYTQTGGYDDWLLDFSHQLSYTLPEGYRFAEGKLDIAKASICCWKGFGHEEENVPWDGHIEDGLMLETAPHFTGEHALAVEDAQGNYVCYAGMWWTPDNALAYMEPLCTVPEHRGKGLAAAVLTELQRRMQRLGATHMTGGGSPFYRKIGYQQQFRWTFWQKGKA